MARTGFVPVLAVLLGLSAPGVRADTTLILPGPEVPLAEPGGILDQLYGLRNLERVEDFLALGILAEDELWSSAGSTTVVAQAKFAGLTNTLGFFDGETSTTFNPVLTVSGNCFGDCSASASFSHSGVFRFGLSTSGGDLWSSRISDNPDAPKDHMVTFRVVRSDEAHPNNPVGAFVIAWEDKPDASDDADYNDLVVEVTGSAEPAFCGDGVVSGDEECDTTDPTCCACHNVDILGTDQIDNIDIAAEGFPNGAVVNVLAGADTVIGSEGPDVICGGKSADDLSGNGGDDIILGESESDTILGGDGSDHLIGDSGADTMVGGLGDDVLEGGDGADNMSGDAGDDTLHGGGGADILNGGDGFDLLVGGDGPDNMDGGGDDDALFGDGSADTMNGGDGNDLVLGGPATDTLNGGPGDDVLDGESGSRDKLFGDDGDDDLDGGSGLVDVCDGGPGTDTATADCEKVFEVP